jgi:hypothetical protein
LWWVRTNWRAGYAEAASMDRKAREAAVGLFLADEADAEPIRDII